MLYVSKYFLLLGDVSLGFSYHFSCITIYYKDYRIAMQGIFCFIVSGFIMLQSYFPSQAVTDSLQKYYNVLKMMRKTCRNSSIHQHYYEKSFSKFYPDSVPCFLTFLIPFYWKFLIQHFKIFSEVWTYLSRFFSSFQLHYNIF